ncbi:MAG TPA: hypothetical protein VH079_02610 [Terriglobales bacterium]|jgi:hypothetical protein|nr:hypothetical protein [Terriglobales bacterium]
MKAANETVTAMSQGLTAGLTAGVSSTKIGTPVLTAVDKRM